MPEKISFSPALLETHCIIDARTPLEFAEDHLPGAYNLPILTNEERVEIGTIHKQQGPQQARVRGLELTCSRFGAMVREAIEQAAGRPILVYCWRGGLRSLSLAILLEMSGYPVVQLRGGYKAFRAEVIEYFERFVPPAPLVVLHGMTGSGKTVFINGLDNSHWTVIDLEGLARHRGSAFGSMGMGQQPTQKRFDTMLWDALRKAPTDRPVVVEGESQRIGNISLPGQVYDVMAQGCKIWCRVTLERRVERLAAEYALDEYREPMEQSLGRIRKKLGGVLHDEMRQMLAQWDIAGLARSLVTEYYDKLYYKHRNWELDGEIDLDDYKNGETQLLALWHNRCAGQQP